MKQVFPKFTRPQTRPGKNLWLQHHKELKDIITIMSQY